MADAATEPRILQRNESRDIHMPRGALNSEGSKNQDPRPLAQTARDKDGVPGPLSFTVIVRKAPALMPGDG